MLGNVKTFVSHFEDFERFVKGLNEERRQDFQVCSNDDCDDCGAREDEVSPDFHPCHHPKALMRQRDYQDYRGETLEKLHDEYDACAPGIGEADIDTQSSSASTGSAVLSCMAG